MMNPRIKFALISVAFLSIANVGIGAYKTNLNREPKAEATNQGQERLVVNKSRSDAPVKITLVKTKKRVIEDNKKFSDDDDWLQGLALRVVNRSDKTVTYVGIQLIFRRTEDQESGLPVAWPLNYGFNPFDLNPGDSFPPPEVAPILAGADSELRLSEAEYEEVKKSLAEIGFPASRKRIELDIIVIGFSDGTAWNNGHMFRRDPNSLGGPLKGWRLLDEPGNGKAQPERPKGSAQRHPAFFMNAAFNSYHKSDWRVSKVLPTAGRVTDVVTCGTVIYELVSCGNLPGYNCRKNQAALFYNPISQPEATRTNYTPCTAVAKRRNNFLRSACAFHGKNTVPDSYT
jgi:hypothetical protein